jgi:hypothetical protein
MPFSSPQRNFSHKKAQKAQKGLTVDSAWCPKQRLSILISFCAFGAFLWLKFFCGTIPKT